MKMTNVKLSKRISQFTLFIAEITMCLLFATTSVHAATPEEQALLLQSQYQQALMAQNAQYQQVTFAQAQYQQALQIQLLQAQLLQAQYLQAQALHTQALQAAQLQAEQMAQYQMLMNTQAYNQANAILQFNTLKTAQNIQLGNLYNFAHANPDNYIYGYTEEYRAEQQRATEAYLRYWGMK